MEPRSPELTADAPAEQRLPLSFGQEQLWFLDQLSPGDSTYNVPVIQRLRGTLDVDVLQRALSALVERHETLRATFHAVDGTPFQRIAPVCDAELTSRDLTGVPAGEREDALADALLRETSTPFELAVGPPVRFRLFRLADEDHVLCITAHHIVTDGWSMGVLNRELSVTYRALVEGTPGLPPLPLRYADYVTAQRAALHDNQLDAQLRYWEQQLADLPVLELPQDRSRPAARSSHGGSVTATFPDALLRDLRALGQRQGSSVFMLVTAAVNAVLARCSAQEDIPLGVNMLGRTEPEYESLIGFFTNMVVLRTDLSGDPSFADLADRILDATLDAFDNQEVPFRKVVERVQPVRDPSRNPLFQVSVQLLAEGAAWTDVQLPGITVEPIEAQINRSRFDMALTFVESADRLRLVIEYSTDLFDHWRIEAFARHIENLLAAAAADPSQPISRAPMLSGAETDALLAAGRGQPLAYTEDPVHVVLARTAAAAPDAVAAVCNGRELTYGELHRRADRLARHLRARGVRRDQVVAVVMERDLEALVAILGIMKAGAAFAVLDAKQPAARLAFMLQDTGAPVVLTQSRLVDRLPEPSGWAAVALDTDWDAVESTPAAEPWEEWATRDSIAYVLYTSGSSGKPKGVVIEHRALMSFMESYRRTFDLCAEDRMLQLAALSFDMSVGEILAGLAVGAALVLVPPEAGSSPEALADLMRRERVSYICMSPAMLALVEAGPYPDLRKIMAGGEAVPAEAVNKWNLPGRRFINVYGPTEAAVGCTAYECEHFPRQSAPPIGVPFCDRRMYVVDSRGALMPKGAPGELLIGGDEGLARGYLNQPALTAERFVRDPFHPEGRVYHSGDLVRWTEDFQLEFLGRLDNQVKLHGLRIELEEIESALLAHPLVGMAAVSVRTDPAGEKRLVGYVVGANGEQPLMADLRRHLGEQVPEYMVPSVWMMLDALPLTTARKVDRAALPAPDQLALAAEREFVAPRTSTEERVAEAFAEVLGQPRVGADGNFFELGGSSLQAMRAISRLNRAFNIKVNVRGLYGAATVSGVAATVDRLVAEKASADGREGPSRPGERSGDAAPALGAGALVPIRASGSRAPLYCVHAASGSPFVYAELARGLDGGQPVYGFEAAGLEGDRQPLTSVPELSAAYVAALPALEPGGARCLLGWSMGGVVAFDMAQRLAARDEQPAVVILVDTPVPEPTGMPPESAVLYQFMRDLVLVAGTPTGAVDAVFASLPADPEPAAVFAAVGAARLVPPEMDAAALARRYRVFRANVEALHGHRPRTGYEGRVVVIRGTESWTAAMDWREFASDVEEHSVTGDHHSLWAGAGLVAMGEIVQRSLDGALGAARA